MNRSKYLNIKDLVAREGIAEHYIDASDSLAGVILNPSVPPAA